MTLRRVLDAWYSEYTKQLEARVSSPSVVRLGELWDISEFGLGAEFGLTIVSYSIGDNMYCIAMKASDTAQDPCTEEFMEEISS